jgi:hypothetical protein
MSVTAAENIERNSEGLFNSYNKEQGGGDYIKNYRTFTRASAR